VSANRVSTAKENAMHIGLLVLSLLMFVTSATPAAQGSDSAPSLAQRFGGTWSGAWSGDDSGTFEMTLTPSADGKHMGTLHGTDADGSTFGAEFKALSFEGQKMKASYDEPIGGGAVGTLEGTFDGNTASGTWSYRQASGITTSGTWKASRSTPSQPK
jgi:hypothetical protein